MFINTREMYTYTADVFFHSNFVSLKSYHTHTHTIRGFARDDVIQTVHVLRGTDNCPGYLAIAITKVRSEM